MSEHRTPLPTDPLERGLSRARGILPDQGPIGVFIHHNTLHAFQHLPFHAGVQAGAAALGARPYLSLDRFRAEMRAGRIEDQDLRTEIALSLGDAHGEDVVPGLTRGSLHYTLMVHECELDDAHGLVYTMRAGTAAQCRDLPLWHACLSRLSRGPALPRPDNRVVHRHRDVLVALGADDPDVAVHGELIRLSAGFLDHGQAHATLPGRSQGFLRAVASLYAGGAAAPLVCSGAERDLADVAARGLGARQVICDALEALGVRDEATEHVVLASALALPGWAGMFSRLERHPDQHAVDAPASLEEFLAVRLLFERRAVQRTCSALGVPDDWSLLRSALPPPPARSPELDAALLWLIASDAAWSPEMVAALDDEGLRRLWDATGAFDEVARGQVFQDAFERTYRCTILDALATRQAMAVTPSPERPRAQFVFCIDEREESIRRALEEQHPGYVTFGVAGFFGVAIDYQGLYDREPAAYCPVVVTPGHEVHERPVAAHLDWHAARERLRQHWHRWERRAASSSRTLSGGAGMSFLLGPVSALRTLAHVLAPRSFLALGARMTSTVLPRPSTHLSAVRRETEATSDRGKALGFSTGEAADRVVSVLRNIGLVRDIAPIVVVLGHGSTSLNNPHESAHDCGACGGRRGGANARLFADMANRPEVREAVRQRSLPLPDDVWFVGALHDTANDNIEYHDLDRMPAAHDAAFREAYEALERARRDNAVERSRRFDDAALTQSPDEALRHVEARAAHLAQPRPEYGHCTNASCIVGRRDVTRGLHLDRRAFLVSYDPHSDPDDAILERILAAVGPVGAGISLEYYFSSVDNETFGCGTKLPHNVTGLIGVMNGHQSDLRTGLPLQMVELHEPMRLLIVVDATEASLLAVASRQPEIAELVGNGWVQLVAMHPDSGALSVFERGGFVPYAPRTTRLPQVEWSRAWHSRSRDHLLPALVRRGWSQDLTGTATAGLAEGELHV